MEIGAPGQKVVRFGLYEADLQQRVLTKGGLRVRLQDQPFQVLALLLERPGELVTREVIQQKLWPADTYVAFDDGLNTAIKKLRSALSDTADNPRFIETVPRRGYRFVAPVTSPALPVATEPVKPPDVPADSVLVAARERSRVVIESVPARSPRRWGYLVLVLILMIGAGGYFYRAHLRPVPADHESRAMRVDPTIKLRPSVAVLGFRNLSKHSEQEWLSTAISEMLTTELSAGEELRTVPGESVARMKVDLSLPESDSYAGDTLARIRKNLDADFVVLGSFFDLGKESAGSLRLDLRLQDARSGETLATITATGKEVSLPDLASRVGAELRQKLGIAQLSLAQAANVNASLPSGPDTARLYSEGLSRLRNFDNLRARDLLEKAVAAEPNFALAHAALADAWSGLGYDAKAREEAEKAFDLSGPLSREQRLWVEGRYREATHEWDKAIEIYRSVYSFFPDNLEYGLRLAKVQASSGRAREALATLDELRRLPAPASDDPRIDQAEAEAAAAIGDYTRDLNSASRAADKGQAVGARLLVARARHFQCWAAHKLGQVKKAEDFCEEAQRLFAEAGDRDMVASLMVTTAAILEERGQLAAAQSRYEEAIPIYRETGDRGGLAIALNNLAITHRNAGNYAAAKKMYEESIAIARETGNKDGLVLAMGNFAGLLFYEGNLRRAHDIYEELLVTCRELGTKDRIALQLDNFGQTLLFQGDLQGAERALNEAKSLDSESGEKRQLGYHLMALGDIFEAEGKLPEAEQNRLEALKLRTELGDKGDAADTHVSLAEGAIEEGRPAEAEAPLREAITELTALKAMDDEAAAYSMLARALLLLGKPADALKVVETASPLVEQSQNRGVHLAFGIVAARVRAANGRSDEAVQSLGKVLAEATKSGFAGYALDARLALAEIGLKTPKSAAAKSSLVEIEKDARSRGFNLIARKAAAAR